ncbi:MAG: nucleotide sugar dehydrogenase [Bacteroidota bacterium]
MKIGIVGLGYVGLTLGIASAIKGIDVVGVEKNKKILDSLRKGKAHFYEPGINNHLNHVLNRNLKVLGGYDHTEEFDVFIITVGTPLKKGTKEPNYEYLKSAIDMIADHYSGDQVIILRSTVSVGTSNEIVIPYLKEKLNLNEDKIHVSFCPERTIEGNAINELFSLPQIIGSNNKTAYNKAEFFFREITPYIIKVDSLEAAELVKLFNNTYRDIHFAMGNAFNEIAQSFGLNGYDVIKASNQGYKRSNIALPGYVGGPCLEKDPYILSVNMPEIEGKNFVLNARRFNESLEDLVVNWVIDTTENLNLERKIGISGLAFKGIPDTSDLRGSNAVNIALKLKGQGFDLEIHDYLADPYEMIDLNLGVIQQDLLKLVSNNRIILLMNNNPRYKKLDFTSIAQFEEDKIILDSWNVFDLKTKINETVEIKTLGNFLVNE